MKPSGGDSPHNAPVVLKVLYSCSVPFESLARLLVKFPADRNEFRRPHIEQENVIIHVTKDVSYGRGGRYLIVENDVAQATTVHSVAVAGLRFERNEIVTVEPIESIPRRKP